MTVAGTFPALQYAKALRNALTCVSLQDAKITAVELVHQFCLVSHQEPPIHCLNTPRQVILLYANMTALSHGARCHHKMLRDGESTHVSPQDAKLRITEHIDLF